MILKMVGVGMYELLTVLISRCYFNLGVVATLMTVNWDSKTVRY